MPKAVDDCVKALMKDGKSEDQAWAICQSQHAEKTYKDSDVIEVSINDHLTFDPNHKTAISMRDGFQEYLGMEIGLEPADKVFRIYRSPASIANIASMTQGIPLTNEHVSMEKDPTETHGRVLEAELIDLKQVDTGSTLAVRNTVQVDETLMPYLEAGKRELSLGYKARLVPSDEYDYEQVGIIPHHLAVVSNGRCGTTCRFLDDKGVGEMHKAFLDAEGKPSLKQIMEVANALPEAMGELSVDEVAKVYPTLESVVKGMSPEEESQEDVEDVESEEEEPEDEMEDKSDKSDEEETSMQDTAEFKDAVAKAVDSKLEVAVKKHGAVITKARKFVDTSYDFSDKTTCQIMKDAVNAVHGSVEFSDEELPVAFKLLQKPSDDLSNFGDNASTEPASLSKRVEEKWGNK